MSTSRIPGILIAALCLLAATTSCAGSSSSQEVDIATVRSEMASELASAQDRADSAEAATKKATAELSEAQAAIEKQGERIDELTLQAEERNTGIKVLETEVETLKAESSQLSESLATSNGRAADAQERADTAEGEAQELRTRYDANIRADAQLAWDTEIGAACTKAGAGSASIGSYVDFSEQLAVIGTKDELTELVRACAEPLRNRSLEEKLNAECERGSIDQIIKAPDELAGNCYVIFVIPWQWDSRTGACNFLGAWDGSNQGTRRFNYDGDGIFRAPPSVCDDDLADADQDDLLQVWVDLSGSFAYDTAAGGTNEIPDFTIRRAVLITKA